MHYITSRGIVCFCLLTFACSCLCFQTCPLFSSQLSISHCWIQGKLQAEGVKYDRWYMHVGKVHCIRLPEFLIPLLDTVGLISSCYYNPHFYASKNGASALRAKFLILFQQMGGQCCFSFAGHREARVWGLPLTQAAASTELWYSWPLDGKGRELIFYPHLKDRRQWSQIFGGICNSDLLSLSQLWLFSDFLLGNICLI